MKVLSFSLDPQILNPQSVVASRNVRYGEALERLSIIVPSVERTTVVLSPRVTVYGTGGRFKALQLFGLFLKAVSILRKEWHDVISSQDMYFLGMLAAIVARMFGCGLEIQVHGIEKIETRIFLARFVLHKAGSVRVPTSRLRDYLIDKLQLVPNKVSVVPVYVDTASFAAIQRTETDKEQFDILSVNRLVPIKNISLQLQVIKVLEREYSQVHLHIVGDGPLREELNAQIHSLDIEDKVTLHGYTTGRELIDLYTQADCFVLTSDFEGYGMAVVEAAAAGLPIVMTDVGCARDFLKHEVNGLVVPIKDSQTLTASVRRLIDDDLLRRQLGERARAASLSLTGFEKTLRSYLNSWETALHNK